MRARDHFERAPPHRRVLKRNPDRNTIEGTGFEGDILVGGIEAFIVEGHVHQDGRRDAHHGELSDAAAFRNLKQFLCAERSMTP